LLTIIGKAAFGSPWPLCGTYRRQRILSVSRAELKHLCTDFVHRFCLNDAPAQDEALRRCRPTAPGRRHAMDKVSLDGRLVCVVDDDAIYRQYLSALLVSKKLDVVEASDGGELIDILKNRSIDCIVLDYVLASESGLTLHEHLRGQFRKPPPVVMLTADENQRTVIKAFRTGVSDYVLKRGLRPDELTSAICNAISRRRQEDAAEEDLVRLRRLSALDDVTGLYRREAVEERLQRTAKAASRRKGQYAVLVMALNEFETIETQFGHLIGDRLLRSAATRLKSEIRDTDICGRWDADSFICVIELNADRQAVDQFKIKLEQALSFELRLDAMSSQISASLGAAIYPLDGSTPGAIVAVAERNMAAVRAEKTPQHQNAGNGCDSVGEAPAVGRQEDRRKERRHRILKRGQIVINEMHSVIDCTIRDLTANGARLRIDSHFAAPEQFDLVILGAEASKRVRVRWQRGKELGVQFIG
jgi:diguanylate cyclase (GGDEF)-like protein